MLLHMLLLLRLLFLLLRGSLMSRLRVPRLLLFLLLLLRLPRLPLLMGLPHASKVLLLVPDSAAGVARGRR